MISLVFLCSLVVLASAQYPYNNGAYNQQQHQGGANNSPAPVHYVNIGAQLQGDYKFGYNTGNTGSFREETRNPDGSVSGAYGYIDGSGQQKVIRYTAGKDGFKAEGDDIPKAPPAPQPAAPQAYQPQAPAYNQQSYNPAPAYNHNNYVQHQPNYNTYSQPQQYNNQQGSYNPYNYIGHSNPGAPAQPNPAAQLSYNIGAGGSQNAYQG